MALTTAIAIYFVIWWVALFAVLPWGVRSQEESGEIVPGSDPGAPHLPKVVQKLIWTTIVSLVVFAIFSVIYRYRLISIDALTPWLGNSR